MVAKKRKNAKLTEKTVRLPEKTKTGDNIQSTKENGENVFTHENMSRAVNSMKMPVTKQFLSMLFLLVKDIIYPQDCFLLEICVKCIVLSVVFSIGCLVIFALKLITYSFTMFLGSVSMFVCTVSSLVIMIHVIFCDTCRKSKSTYRGIKTLGK